ncbi:MAG TPA: hypothetical protein VF342_03735 [Alphaproteobacteria bacterium]
MGRILLLYVLPILLPTLAYLAWLAVERRRVARAGEANMRRWPDLPWLSLLLLGLALAVTAGVVKHLVTASGTQGVYVPPRLIDGRIVPGHVEPAPR